MSKKKIPIGITIALSGVMAAQSCGSHAQSPSNGTKNQQKNSMSADSVRLEKKLLELSKTKFNGELTVGAMCYVMVAPEYVDYTCQTCNKVIKNKINSYQMNDLHKIETAVKQIKEAGYDVVLDQSEFCEHCSKQAIAYPELIFKIRFSANAEYHMVKSNIVNEYTCLLKFIEGSDKYGDHINGEEYALHDNIHIIQKMTGLGSEIEQNR